MPTVLTSSTRTVRFKRSDPREISPPTANSDATGATVAPAVKRLHLVEHPLAQHALTALRDKHTPPPEFRVISNQLLILLALEATRTLPVRNHAVETATGPHVGQVLTKPVVFLSITRHGLGLAHSMADIFPNLLVGAISLDRAGEGQDYEPRLHIVNAPALSDARVILFDPVVASGLSATLALNLVRRSGATDISFVSFLVSLPGLSRLQSALPDLMVWTAAIDTELDPKRGPLPGMGNFAERLYS